MRVVVLVDLGVIQEILRLAKLPDGQPRVGGRAALYEVDGDLLPRRQGNPSGPGLPGVGSADRGRENGAVNEPVVAKAVGLDGVALRQNDDAQELLVPLIEE